MLSNDLFAKVLRRLATCLSVNKSLRGKLVSSSLVIFNDNFRATSVSFFVADFNLLNYEVDKFKFSLPLREKCSYSELFWSVFPAFRLNTDQNNSEHGHFLHSGRNISILILCPWFLENSIVTSHFVVTVKP